MKRTTIDTIAWHMRRARNESRRAYRRLKTEAIRIVKRDETEPSSRTPRLVARPIDDQASRPKFAFARGSRRKRHEFIIPPSDFSLRRNYNDVAAFFSHFRSMVYDEDAFRRRRFGIEFSALRSLSPGAGLMLAAELYRVQKFLGRRLSAVRQDDWDPDIARLLHELGLFDLLATPNVKSKGWPPRTDTEILKFSVDTEVTGAKCGYLLDCLSEIAGTIPAENFIYDGLVEALKNSKHHAYSEPGQWFGVDPGTWFMTGSYNKVEKRLVAAVFDLGVGIPHTLPRSGVWEHVRPLLSLGLTSDDGKMIAAAMEYGRTRTTLRERGRGLPIIMRLLDHHKGYLRIVSGKGEAMYDSLTRTIQATSHRESIGGTLIEWSIEQ